MCVCACVCVNVVWIFLCVCVRVRVCVCEGTSFDYTSCDYMKTHTQKHNRCLYSVTQNTHKHSLTHSLTHALTHTPTQSKNHATCTRITYAHTCCLNNYVFVPRSRCV